MQAIPTWGPNIVSNPSGGASHTLRADLRWYNQKDADEPFAWTKLARLTFCISVSLDGAMMGVEDA